MDRVVHLLRPSLLFHFFKDIMGICQCTSWWDKIYRLFAPYWTIDKTPLDIINGIGSELPSDIIVDIVSRLPAQSVRSLCSLTKTPCFVNMHLRRATPTIVFHYYDQVAREENKVICMLDIHFSDDKAQKFVVRNITVDLSSTCREGLSMPLLYGSYNGFLLFRNLYHGPVLHMYNPVTEERKTVIAGDKYTRGYKPCGLFFNPMLEEYKVIFVRAVTAGFDLWEYGLRTRSEREYTNISHPPNYHRFPTIFNRALHWMVDDEEYKDVFGVFPGCSNSIVVFNIESGKFSTMSHPGDQCKNLDKHCFMGLMEMKGQLCYCGGVEEKIGFWALENYKERVWVKIRVIDTCPMQKKCYFCLDTRVFPVSIFGNELLLRLNTLDLFLYNLRLGTFRRVGRKWDSLDHYQQAFVHVSTLVSLCGRVG